MDVVLSNSFTAFPSLMMSNDFRKGNTSPKCFSLFFPPSFLFFFQNTLSLLIFFRLRLCKPFSLDSLLETTQWNVCGPTLQSRLINLFSHCNKSWKGNATVATWLTSIWCKPAGKGRSLGRYQASKIPPVIIQCPVIWQNGSVGIYPLNLCLLRWDFEQCDQGLTWTKPDTLFALSFVWTLHVPKP